jgi:eukaryotic-like serine/threonine-protein kinase
MMSSSGADRLRETIDPLSWLGASAPAIAALAFGGGEGDRTARATDARHLALLPSASLELDLADPVQRDFGDYELLELIGEGGMGVVYRARQKRLDREVAVKLLAAGPWASLDFIARFEQEARSAARMQHPHIVTVHEVGVVEELHFFSMRLVRGQSLADRLRATGPMDADDAARLLRTVAEAVAYAHSLDVLHLDLKPANVLLDEAGLPHVADFGLARKLDLGASTTNEISGTPSYMAPEQTRPDAQALTTATDIWGLGIVLFETLTGTPPFRADSIANTLKLVEEGRVPRPRHLVPTIPRDLEAIVLKCLAREPSARYASARALAEDLGRFLDRRAVHARPLNVGQRLARWMRREPGLAALSAGCLAAILIGLAATTIQWRRAEANAQRAESVRKFLVGVFQEANPDNSRGDPITAKQLLEQGARELDAPAARSPAVQADLASTIGFLFWQVGDYPRAEAILERARAASGSSDVPDEVKARTLVALASVDKETNKFEEARASAAQAIAIAERVGDTADVSAARRVMAEAETMDGRANEAETLLRTALRDDSANDGSDADETVEDRTFLADALYELSRFDESAAMAREAAATSIRQHRDHSTALLALEIESRALQGAGRLAEGEQVLRDAAAMASRLYGPEHRETIVARSNIGYALQAEGRYAEALQDHLDLLPSVERMAAERPEQLAYTYNALAADYVGVGDFVRAEEAAQKSIATWRKIHGGVDHLDSGDALKSLGIALQWQGRYADAEAALRRELALEGSHESPESGWLNRTRGNLGNVLRLEGRDAESLSMLGEALDALPRNPTQIRAVVESQQALAELEAGDVASARALATDALAMMRRLVQPGGLSLGAPLMSAARTALAAGDPTQAEALAREAHAVRSPPFRDDDPRVLETDAVRIEALHLLGRDAEASALAAHFDRAIATLPESLASELSLGVTPQARTDAVSRTRKTKAP